MFDLLDFYIWITWVCLGCVAGIYFGYWLRKRDEADGVVSALRTALDEGAVPEVVRQEVLFTSPSIQLLAIAHWKLKHSARGTQAVKPGDYKRCRSIASRIMLIK